MIEILGVNEGKEFEAATHLRRKILAVWPDLAQSPTDHVRIYVGLKLYGHRIEDLDLLVIGHFERSRPFSVEYKFYPKNGDPFVPRSASIKSFVLVIEAKSHDATGVRFTDKTASVRYVRGGRETWENVTEKNRDQMFEFKKYLERQGITKIYVQDLIFLSGLRETDLPQRPHNCFGLDASFERLLNIVGQISLPKYDGRDVSISFGADEVFREMFAPESPLLKILEPTPLDRRRMDRIVRSALPDTWIDDLGVRQVTIRGRGGVGKTVILLQMAYRAYDQHGTRSLMLTYNKALVADMRRTMALLGVPRSIEQGGIAIETVHSFIGRLMLELGIIKSYDGFLDKYDEGKQTLLAFLRTNTVSKADLDQLFEKHPEDFLWDAVFVDEGQDWPVDEIEILRSVYGAERLAVADGVDQFVRHSVADWSVGIPRERLQTHRLRRCLRMKANLSYFVTDFARELGLADWELQPNSEANGGRVIVVEGVLSDDVSIYSRLAAEAAALGNYPIDLLACVPPTLVDNSRGEAMSAPGKALQAVGLPVWDASSVDVREHYPSNRDALRIVQYDSCRGLEGWTVINYAFDELWNYKFSQWTKAPHDYGGLFETDEERAVLFASQWAMIPLTRAMDTLVINVGRHDSRVKRALANVHRTRSDFVEWISLDR